MSRDRYPEKRRRRGKPWCMECEKKPTSECEEFNHDVTVVDGGDEED